MVASAVVEGGGGVDEDEPDELEPWPQLKAMNRIPLAMAARQRGLL
jgi:hypothetical protein